MLQLRNKTPFEAGLLALPELDGVEALFVVVKASFRFGATLEIAPEQRPLTMAEEYWGEPASSSLRYPSDIHPSKPGTDVIVNADACGPRGNAVTELDVAVRIADRTKYLRVTGDRHWTVHRGGHGPSKPQPFNRLPLTYERAYGGREPGSGASYEPSNPVGVGFVGERSPHELLGQPVPNIEEPGALIMALGQRPTPAGFGAIAASWRPRSDYAGTYDARWQRERAPFLPADFDRRFFNSAAPGLHFEHGLEGGEPIVLVGLHPTRRWELTLPRCSFELELLERGRPLQLQPRLDTVLIDVNDELMTLTWRAGHRVGERLLDVQRARVSLSSLEGAVDPGGQGT